MVSFSSTSGLNTPDDSGRSLRCNGVTFWATFRKLARLPVPSLRHHAWFILCVLAYAALCLVIAVMVNATDKISFAIYSNEIHLMTVLFFVSFFIGHALYVMVAKRPEALTSYILNDLKTRYVTKDRVLNALPILLCMPVFISAFTSFKSILPIANPYSWDPLFADWDRILHGGIHPWQLMHGILARPLITSILNFFYNLWFFIMYGVLFWQAFSMRNPRIRMQFFLTFTASWALLGTAVAGLFSSGGPCFYGRITGLPDPLPGPDGLPAAIRRPGSRLLTCSAKSFIESVSRWGGGIRQLDFGHAKNSHIEHNPAYPCRYPDQSIFGIAFSTYA